jgi:excisionase family DNA binding protein
MIAHRLIAQRSVENRAVYGKAVRSIRYAYQETQHLFAERIQVSPMSLSRFERGKQVPRDPVVLYNLLCAAGEADLDTERQLFTMACELALHRRKRPIPNGLAAAVSKWTKAGRPLPRPTAPPPTPPPTPLPAQIIPCANPRPTTDVMNPRDVARESGIGLNAIYSMLKAGQIPSFRVGKKFCVSRAVYQQWLASFHGTVARPQNKPAEAS